MMVYEQDENVCINYCITSNFSMFWLTIMIYKSTNKNILQLIKNYKPPILNKNSAFHSLCVCFAQCAAAWNMLMYIFQL